MKFLPSKKWALALIPAIILFFVIVGFASSGKPKETYVTDTVRRGNLTQTVEVTGELSALKEADLSFAQSGIIESNNVEVGDFVSPGQILATLQDSGSEGDAAKALADLNSKKAAPTAAEIKMAEAQITIAKANKASADVEKENAEKRIPFVQISAEANVQTAETALKRAEADAADTDTNNGTGNTSVIQDYILEASRAAASVRSALSVADQILGVENTSFNDDFERELSAVNPNAVTSAKDAFKEAAAYRNQAEAAVRALTLTSSATDFVNADRFASLALTKTDEALLYTRQTLDATYGGSVGLSLSDLVSYKASIDSARSSLTSEINAYTKARTAYLNIGTNNGQSETSATLAVETAQANLKKAEADRDQSIADAYANVATASAASDARAADVLNAEANYENVTADPRSVDLAPYYALLSSANARLRNSQIRAPFAGRVTAVAMSEGEAASFGSAAINVEATGKAFEIKTNIPESDISKVSVGDKAEITLDAFGDDVIFEGEVIAVNQSEKTIEGVVFYEATVVLNGTEDTSKLKSGMSTDVTITTDTRENVLFVPSRSILEKDGKKYVRVASGDSYVEKTVTPGLRADDGFTEILSGLTEGEEIVVSIKK
jgi:RND family efflux transporter MFP subunit